MGDRIGIVVELTWDDPRELIVDASGTDVMVRAHAGLSEPQVRAACSDLGADGDRILTEWRRTVGLAAS